MPNSANLDAVVQRYRRRVKTFPLAAAMAALSLTHVMFRWILLVPRPFFCLQLAMSFFLNSDIQAEGVAL
jgi:hypothetical protein